MPAVKTHSSILEALIAHTKLFVTEPELPLHFPETKFDAPSRGQWLRVTWIPNRGEEPFLGNDEPAIQRGIYQIGVCSWRGLGVPALARTADLLVSHFPQGLRVEHEGVAVRITEEADVSVSPVEIEAGTAVMLPVSIRYRACE